MMRFTGVLAGVCIIAAIILSGLYNITKPLIAQQAAKETQQALVKVVPGADAYEKKTFSMGEYFECSHDNKLIGYAVFIKGSGYAGDIQMLLGIDKDGTILGLEILSQAETPGLGARCTETKQGQDGPWFLQQFQGKKASALQLKHIEAITGATITSEAILDSIKTNTERFLKEIR
jgi:Na+-translocating ferredoxin:NAD+ oxidoreductase subunit G